MKPHRELYDLEKDPQEMSNVIADPACVPTGVKLGAQLAELKAKISDTTTRMRRIQS